MSATIYLKDLNVVVETVKEKKLIPTRRFSIDPNQDNMNIWDEKEYNKTFHFSEVTGKDSNGVDLPAFTSIQELEDYLSPFVNFKNGGDTGNNGGVELQSLLLEVNKLKDSFNFSQTQWSSSIDSSLSVPTGNSVNLFTLLSDSDQSADGTTSYDSYSINQDNLIVVPYVGKPYEGLRIKHDIRLNFNINTGNVQNYKIELRRFDDSVIGSPLKVTRNPDETGVQEILMTYVSSDTDSFVTGGFYVAFINESGVNSSLSGSIGLLIFNTFQKPVYFN